MASITYSTKQAYAVYSADDQSLNFYKRTTVPNESSSFNGKKASKVYFGFENLQSFAFPPWEESCENKVKSVTVVDNGISPTSMFAWFSSFSELRSVDVKKLDTSKVLNMNYLFCGCKKLSVIDLSNFNTKNVKSMREMFGGCLELSSLNISKLNTSNVTDMFYMFSGCQKLTTLDLSNFNTGNVTDMWGMFNGCSGLLSLNVSSFNTSTLKHMERMFKDCSSLKSIDISNFNTHNVLTMGEMFKGCRSLRADCSRWDVSSVYAHKDFNTNAPGVTAPIWVN